MARVEAATYLVVEDGFDWLEEMIAAMLLL